MFRLSYGLFVVTAREGDKDNGCITNTVQQVTVTPNRITVAVNKANYTCGMIERTRKFNVSPRSLRSTLSSTGDSRAEPMSTRLWASLSLAPRMV